MQKAPGEDEINAIVGAALKAMVESGAPTARIGSFAASFRDEVAEILGHRPKEPDAPDLLALITSAVKSALQDPTVNPALGKVRKPGALKLYVTVQGRKTSVTMPFELVSSLDNLMGGRKQTSSLVEQLAQAAPSDVPNRSRWIHERAQAYLRRAQDQSPTH